MSQGIAASSTLIANLRAKPQLAKLAKSTNDGNDNVTFTLNDKTVHTFDSATAALVSAEIAKIRKMTGK